MIDETTNPWDHPEANPPVDSVAVLTTPTQLLDGLPVGAASRDVTCTGCQQPCREGQTITVAAYRRPEAVTWDVPRVYCRGCAPTAIETPTLGGAELLASATLSMRSFPATRTHRLCLTEVVVEARSPPTEGTAP